MQSATILRSVVRLGVPLAVALVLAACATVVSDYAAIAGWASSMALLSERVLEARAAPGSPASPASPESVRRRDALRSALARALRDTRPQFGEPWGLVAMALAAAGRAHARVAVSGPQVALAWQTPGWPGVLP